MKGQPQDPDLGATLEEIGQALGVTRERARQIEAAALRKLRVRCEAEGIDLADMLDAWRSMPGSSVVPREGNSWCTPGESSTASLAIERWVVGGPTP